MMPVGQTNLSDGTFFKDKLLSGLCPTGPNEEWPVSGQAIIVMKFRGRESFGTCLVSISEGVIG